MALKRKKQHEHTLEQTNGQISMLEQQIYSIESANINQETLAAMKNAGAAIQKIHGKMTIQDVDNTMSVYLPMHLQLLPTISHFSPFGPHLYTGLIPANPQGISARTARTHTRNRQRHHLDADHGAR